MNESNYQSKIHARATQVLEAIADCDAVDAEAVLALCKEMVRYAMNREREDQRRGLEASISFAARMTGIPVPADFGPLEVIDLRGKIPQPPAGPDWVKDEIEDGA